VWISELAIYQKKETEPFIQAFVFYLENSVNGGERVKHQYRWFSKELENKKLFDIIQLFF